MTLLVVAVGRIRLPARLLTTFRHGVITYVSENLAARDDIA
jgi:hypothetical protein